MKCGVLKQKVEGSLAHVIKMAYVCLALIIRYCLYVKSSKEITTLIFDLRLKFT